MNASPAILPAGPELTDLRSSAPGNRRIRVTTKIRLALGVLLTAYAAMAYSGSWSHGLSFDEGQQLAIGWNLWLNGDYRIEGGNGDLVKRWATLPYLISRPNFLSRDDPIWHAGDPYNIADEFFFGSGNDPESLLRQGRAMMVLLGVLTGLLVFHCARELFGSGGALIATTVFVLSPHMLAFGGIVSTDLTISATLLAATWLVWRLLHEVTLGLTVASLIVFGLLVLAKPSALVILPVTAVLVGIKLHRALPLTLRWRQNTWIIARRHQQAAVFAGFVLLHAAAGWGAIWAHYGFRYVASPAPADTRLELPRPPLTGDEPDAVMAILDWSRETRFFPEGFRRGIRVLLGGVKHLRSFMHGEWTAGGRWDFFPYAIWVKTQPAVPLLLMLGLGLWWRQRQSAAKATSPGRRTGGGTAPRSTAPATSATRPSLYALTPFIVLIAVYLGVAMTEDVNLGHRHVLPIYPAAYILCGGAILAWNARAAWSRFALMGILAFTVYESWKVRPNYLAYFGPQAGGPDDGYRHLVDSSLDWGMNLPGLREWLDEHDPERREQLFLAYFGTDSPEHYGIRCQKLPGFFDWREFEPYGLKPGYYAISATLLQSVYTTAFGPWTKDYETLYQAVRRNVEIYETTSSNFAARANLVRHAPPGYWDSQFQNYDHLRFARLCAWLRQQGEPPHHIGHAIFIWKLSQEDLREALFGPPPELTEGYTIAGRD